MGEAGRWSRGPGQGALPAGSTPRAPQSWCLGARGSPLVFACSLPSHLGDTVLAGPQRSQHLPLPSCVEFQWGWGWHLGHLLTWRREAEWGGETRLEPSARAICLFAVPRVQLGELLGSSPWASPGATSLEVSSPAPALGGSPCRCEGHEMSGTPSMLPALEPPSVAHWGERLYCQQQACCRGPGYRSEARGAVEKVGPADELP